MKGFAFNGAGEDGTTTCRAILVKFVEEAEPATMTCARTTRLWNSSDD